MPKATKDFAVERKKLSDLTPDKRNANRGTERGAKAIAQSLKDYGAGRSILLDKHGNIIAGNKTAENAAKAGLGEDVLVVKTDGTKIVAVQRMDLDLAKDAKAKGLAIADNRAGELSLDWDTAVLASFESEIDLTPYFTPAELAAILPAKELLTDEDEVPEPPKVPVTKRGDLWILGDHRLLCGDSTVEADVRRLMGGYRADCVFTSPPYAVGIEYEDYEDTIDNLRAMLPVLAEMWKSVIVEGGFAVTNFGDVLSGRELAKSKTVCEYPMALEYFPVFRSFSYVLWSRRVWCKPGAAVGSSRHCIGSNRAASNFEHVWTWKLPGKPPVNEQISGKWPSQAGWFDTTHDNHLGVGLRVHGAGMPVAVAERSVIWHSRGGSVIHEPFCGTGTTLIACEKTMRHCYAMELSPTYCDVIVERWQNATGKKAVLNGAA